MDVPRRDSNVHLLFDLTAALTPAGGRLPFVLFSGQKTVLFTFEQFLKLVEESEFSAILEVALIGMNDELIVLNDKIYVIWWLPLSCPCSLGVMVFLAASPCTKKRSLP